jgi:hypothetical protein
VKPRGEYKCTAFDITLKFCIDGSMMVANDRNM